ncbi:hypothetical protein A2480_04240 [Candidatus Uhrbacteria bacterium RIFOXYC2_FULL_47_19]|uniref:Type II secretion system protein GspG C-terminal domain-containing protein n=1 Tax=Candidatus Uhrbacteria bacterium RIFOXYC2_FULL_47_19 TaxID=1802424 RepID=A0A1F7WCA0_9BACT|nr:MAG: hypothetical protein A2480_04240 [Candidatus Uhrbacteria bacterium RIFOXYC2_FULL_47_19]HCC22067.1 hypothetical protein [Candidatus Uhrbacteria bacterium]
MRSQQRGFTLTELLVFIAIVGILGAVVFVTIDPLSRFQDSRDSHRSADINAILLAIKTNQIESGSFLPTISRLPVDSVFMIGTASAGCDDQNAVCDTAVTSDASCVDLSELVSGGYLESVPVSPDGLGNWTAVVTGYTLSISTDGTLTVRACESENTSEIKSLK